MRLQAIRRKRRKPVRPCHSAADRIDHALSDITAFLRAGVPVELTRAPFDAFGRPISDPRFRWAAETPGTSPIRTRCLGLGHGGDGRGAAHDRPDRRPDRRGGAAARGRDAQPGRKVLTIQMLPMFSALPTRGPSVERGQARGRSWRRRHRRKFSQASIAAEQRRRCCSAARRNGRRQENETIVSAHSWDRAAAIRKI